MSHEAGKHEVETFSGRFVDVADPDPLDICIEDIAHGLAHTCRYGGQSKGFYSVAQHACLVYSHLGVQPLEVRWAGLHHDDPEAYIGDIPRPLKSLLPDYRALERRLWLAIVAGAGLDKIDCDPEHPSVKAADMWALACEAYHLMRSQGRGWIIDGLYDHAATPIVLACWTPEYAEQRYLERHRNMLVEARTR